MLAEGEAEEGPPLELEAGFVCGEGLDLEGDSHLDLGLVGWGGL